MAAQYCIECGERLSGHWPPNIGNKDGTCIYCEILQEQRARQKGENSHSASHVCSGFCNPEVANKFLDLAKKILSMRSIEIRPHQGRAYEHYMLLRVQAAEALEMFENADHDDAPVDESVQTLAEAISEIMGHDGQRWEAPSGIPLGDLCNAWGAQVQYASGVPSTGTKVRLAFPDGSAIVISGDAWDIEGDTPFSWRG